MPELTTTESDLSGQSEQSGVGPSSDPSGQSVGNPDGTSKSTPEYIYIEYRDGSGNWTSQYRIDYLNAKEMVSEAVSEGNSEQMAVIQGGIADYQEYQMNDTTLCLVILFGIFALFGAIAVGTLIRSFEI